MLCLTNSKAGEVSPSSTTCIQCVYMYTVILFMANVCAVEAVPIFLGELSHEVVATVMSVAYCICTWAFLMHSYM